MVADQSITRDDGGTGDLTALICGVLAEICGAADCGPHDTLAGLGVDSVRAAEAAAVLEAALELPVPLESMLASETPQEAADALMLTWRAGDRSRPAIRDRIASASGAPGTP